MKAKEVKSILGITYVTLNRYIKEGKIKYTKINSNHYIYNDEDVYKLIGIKKEKHKRINISYARVSNKPRKNDLTEQSNRLYNFATSKGLAIDKQFEDIKSGMSFERKEFTEMLNLIIQGKVECLIIENKDRLVRFGFELLEYLFKCYGTTIIVVNDEISNKTYEQELTEDLISIVDYFSMKSDTNRRKLNKIKSELLSDNN
jgi:predicted site-specific integrase-resolvase